MTKITVISHDNGQIEVHGEVPGGVKPFDLLMSAHAFIDCVATYLKQPKQKIIAHLMLLCQMIDDNPDKTNRKAVEIQLPNINKGDKQ